MKNLVIRNKVATKPIIQGGMGVGVSLSGLAGAVAYEGGVGIISTAQIGYYRDDFDENPSKSNLLAIKEQIDKAKAIAKGNGIVGVNVMYALKDYAKHVCAAAEAGADLVICGAGIPIDLPDIVKGYDIAIAPIVSSCRYAKMIIEKWLRSYKRLPDMVVIEGPKAGGHLGFSAEQAVDFPNYDEEIKQIIDYTKKVSDENNVDIPVVVAGGVFNKEDIEHAFSLGAAGVQMASRFVCTDECDASDAYKQAYINASAEDVEIIKSPVGMPGRALRNHFTEITREGKYLVERCRGCLKKCNPEKIPYCITDALIRAVKGDTENGLVFCGSNVGRIDKIVSVHELMEELFG